MVKESFKIDISGISFWRIFEQQMSDEQREMEGVQSRQTQIRLEKTVCIFVNISNLVN